MNSKKLQDLTIKDNFMFAAVMTEPDNCKKLLEMILDIEISDIQVDKEKSLIYHPDYHGIRLDVYAADESNTHYNIEMQAKKCEDIKRRSRFYSSQMDMEMLEKGVDYEFLPNTYVVFICDYDPFGEEKYVYTQKKICVESSTVDMDDGSYALFLSTKGTNKKDVPEELVQFLEFVGKPLAESEKESESAYVRQLQDSVRRIKADREMGARYMTFEQLIKDERKEAMKIARTELLVEQIKKKLEKGKSLEQIAEALEEDVSTIQEMIQEYKLE